MRRERKSKVWLFDELTARGGSTGNAHTSHFEGHRFQREEDLFIRETAQNTIDSGSGEHKPRICLRMVTLSGARKEQFLKATQLDELYGNASLLEAADEHNELRTVRSSRSLGLLYIEDFNTTGLNGVIADPKSNWMRFNMHGDGQKLKEELKIGSFGYGKSVLSRAAGTRSFIVFTAINPNAKDGQTHRLMGHTFQQLFGDEDQYFTGRGWFCEGSDAKNDPIPFTNERAQSLAKELGFSDRSGGNIGTSFLLIGTCPANKPLSIASIRHALETWWWPALLDDRLDVELWENGIQQEGPAPRTRGDLVPYIKCKAKLDSGVGNDVDVTTFRPFDGKKLGRLGLTLAADESVFGDCSNPKTPGPRRVARTRARTGMITEYRGDFGTDKRVAFVGYYFADDEIDMALKLAEPSTHDEWAPANQRLTRFPNGREIVEEIDKRTRNACYEFQRTNSAMRAPLSERLPELERILGAAFDPQAGGSGRKGKSTKKSETLASVEFPGSPVLAPAMAYGAITNRIDGSIRFQLRHGLRQPKRVGIRLLLNVAEDANQAKGEPLALTVTDAKSGKQLYSGDDPRFVLALKPGEPVDVRVESVDYPRHQTVLFDHGEYKP